MTFQGQIIRECLRSVFLHPIICHPDLNATHAGPRRKTITYIFVPGGMGVQWLPAKEEQQRVAAAHHPGNGNGSGNGNGDGICNGNGNRNDNGNDIAMAKKFPEKEIPNI